MSHLISRANLARMLGISKPAVTKHCTNGWAAACEGNRVDTDHPAIQEWAAKHGVNLPRPDRVATKAAKAPPAPPPEPTDVPKPVKTRGPKPTRQRPEEETLPEQPDDEGSLDDLFDLNQLVRPLLERFKSAPAAREWAKFQSILATTEGRKLANAQTRGLVISREFVRAQVIGLIDGMTSRLLADVPKTLCRQLYALARSGAPVEEAEKTTRALLGKQIGSVKTQAEKAILHGDRGNRGGSGVARGADRVDHDRTDPS